MRKITAILACSFLISLAACTWSDTRAYYSAHPMSPEDVSSLWGEPVSVEVLENGAMKWVYYYYDNFVEYESFFLFREGRVVDFGLE